MNFSTLLSFVLAHLWQSTLFAGAAWLVTVVLLQNNRAQVRYAVWLSASLKFLVPFAALSAMGNRMGWLRHGAATAPTGFAYVLDQVTLRVTEPPLVPSAVSPAVFTAGSLLPYFLLLWACGVVAVAAGWWVRARQIRAAMRNAKPLCRYRGLQVLSSPALRERGLEPGVFGLWKPVLLVPEGIQEHLTPEEFQSVLAHERSHVQRRDNIAAAIHMSVESLFWFHPMVWWIGKHMILERERACDQDVVRSGSDPAIYAQGILNVCKLYLESPLPCVPGVTGADLRRRIEEIMTRRSGTNLNLAKRMLLGTAAAVAIAGPILFGLIHAPVARAQAPSSFTGLATSAVRKFDVATIKENVSVTDDWMLGKPNRGNETIRNFALRKIIASSFRIQDKMVFGPDWMDKVHYDIVAKGPNPEASNPEVWEMMRSLLAERFHLKYHIETREMAVYALSIAKGGAKLIKGEDGRCKDKIQQGDTNCGSIGFLPFGVEIVNTPIGGLTGALARTLQDRPIVDKTGLPDRYDIRVLWMTDNVKPEDLTSIPEELRPPDMSMFQAFEKQAGLKLEATRTGVPVVVVDNIEKPSEN
jgi:bla regulator protein BlaR1